MTRGAWMHAAALLAAGAAAAATPPAGFRDTVVVSVAVPTAVAYEPGSASLFVLSKGNGSDNGTAAVTRKDAGTGAVTVAKTLSCVDSRGERGLLGIAFDPDYLALGPSQRYVYLYYTRAVPGSGACAISGLSGSRNRVSRFLESGGALGAEEPLLEGPVLTGATNHNGGTLRFASDKALFVSMGDNDTDGDANPRSRDLNDLRGKLLRIRRDGTVPGDNPFAGQPGRRGEIWAWGLRNPFRFSIDPQTQIPWIADVGENRLEEIDRGVAGGDYGYPCFEGTESFRSCSPTSPIFPEYQYGHSPDQTPPVSGSSITGGPVYRGGNFPADYQGDIFFGDYSDGWIRRANVDAQGNVSGVQMFIPDAFAVVDIVQAPSGCLAWVSINSGDVHETCVIGGTNRAPAAVASGSPTSGPVPLPVQFIGASSSDPDGDPLDFAWVFGDGGTSSTSNPLHTYANPGVYAAVLGVDDGRGAGNSHATAPAIRIVAGNEAPDPSITAPADGSHYDAGDTITFSGGADDPEDGTLSEAHLQWSIVFHHDEHTHPFLGPVEGVAGGTFVIPTAGEDATNVWFRIHLAATDSGDPIGPGATLTSQAFVDVVPNVANIALAASPAGQGLRVNLGGTAGVAPLALDSVVNFPRTIDAPSPQTAAGRTWEFARWNDSAVKLRTIATPAADTQYTASFRCIAACVGLPDPDGDGFTIAQGDCGEGDASTYPGAPDLCDGDDNDCTGSADDGTCDDFDPVDGVDGLDLARLGRYFGACSAQPTLEPWGPVDYTRDGCLDGNDLAVMAAVWGCHGSDPVCE